MIAKRAGIMSTKYYAQTHTQKEGLVIPANIVLR